MSQFGFGRIKKPLSGEDFVRMMNEQKAGVQKAFEPPPELAQQMRDSIDDLYRKIDEDFVGTVKAAYQTDKTVHPLEFHREVRKRLKAVLHMYDDFFSYVVKTTPLVYETDSIDDDDTMSLYVTSVNKFFDELERLENAFYAAGDEEEKESQHEDKEG